MTLDYNAMLGAEMVRLAWQAVSVAPPSQGGIRRYKSNIRGSVSDPILAAASAPFDQALPGFSYDAPPKPPRRMRRRK